MGKNKKAKQVGNSADNAGSIATDRCQDQAPSEFLTSDDFLLVPSKKKSKKNLLESNNAKHPSSLPTELKRETLQNGLPDEEASSKSHTGFWRNRSESENTADGRELDVRSDSGKCQNVVYKNLKNDKAYVRVTNSSVSTLNEGLSEKIKVGECGNVSSNAKEPLVFVTKSSFDLLSEFIDESETESSSSDNVTSEASELQNCSDNVQEDKELEENVRKTEEADDELRLDMQLEHLDVGLSAAKCSEDSAILEASVNCESLKTEASNAGGESTSVSKSSKVGKKSKKKDRKRRDTDEEEVEMLLKELFIGDNCGKQDAKTTGKQNLANGESPTSDGKVKNEESCLAKESQQNGDRTLKTAAQKKKEKRMREKQKRLEKFEQDSKTKSEPDVKTDVALEEVADITDDKLLKKGKKVGEEERKERKKPGKKQLAVIQEALKRAKEEEERYKKEEEARQRAAEEAERQRQEKLRLEQERKDRKKLKEKEKREKMKAEGRLLSKSQKQARARMEATLAAFRQQGIEVPQIGEKKPLGVRLGSFKDTYRRRRLDSQQSTDESSVGTNERRKTMSSSSQESSKDSLCELLTSSDSKDSWEVSSMEGSAVTIESETGQMSCSEDSDILDESSPVSEGAKPFETANLVSIRARVKTPDEAVPSCKGTQRLRSPVVCVLGHVDTGKTKILDYIRKTHIQDSEAGGITQQIGATMIPRDALKEKCKMVRNFSSLELKVPGLLVIDTPGHESFGNLRSRGSSICDIAVLVVDLMHGLEPQTIESINLLKKRKTPFIVALNKIDRLYGWKQTKDMDIEDAINSQDKGTLDEFHDKCREVILQFANQSLNASLFYQNKDPRSYVSMVPTSAVTGDGMGNILSLIAQLSQSMMSKKLTFSEELQATVLEVKAIPGLGTTIDVILVNGRLKEGDIIVLAGQDGPLVSQIRSLVMPQPLKELRVKNPYKEYKEVEGAQGVKLAGKDLDKALAGLPLLVAANHQKVDALKEEISSMLEETMNAIRLSERGVYVQASTLGSLEALLEFLKVSAIPYFGVKIGPVVKKDVMKASIMLEHDSQYAVILAFDVKVERDAQELADKEGVKIFQADVIYHLFDKFIDYRDELRRKRKEEIRSMAVFPCKLKILPDFIFSERDPIVMGVSVEAGTLNVGTPLCVPSRDSLEIGTVSKIESNHCKLDSAKKGQDVCVTVEHKPGDGPKTYGRHFDPTDVIVSRITRQSIDVCKEHFREVLQQSDWQLMIELKKLLQIL